MRPRFFKTASAFERWLAAHHASSDSLLVGFNKKTSGRPGITYPEALDVALGYGWIDGVRTRLDDQTYTIRFTPRKKGSYWSAVNNRRANALIEQGRMKAPGLEAFEARDVERTRRYSYERENATLDAATLRTLRADTKAAAFFSAQPPGYRRIVTHWIASAKKPETRARRLAQLIERSRAGQRIDLLKPLAHE